MHREYWLKIKKKLKVEELISKFELDAVRKVEAKFLSGGMKEDSYKYVFARSPEIRYGWAFDTIDPQTIQMLQTIIINHNLTMA